MGPRFKKKEFWIVVGLFAIDLLSPFVPLVSTALLLAAIFRPSSLRKIAAIALQISEESGPDSGTP